MTLYQNFFSEAIINILQNGGIGVLRTDTLYGLVAKADNQTAVQRVFTIKRRDSLKPPISLISRYDQLWDEHDEHTMRVLNKLWPGPNTVILPSQNGPSWLSCGTDTISYRLPLDVSLVKLIDQTGPIIAPSANPEGAEPAATIEQAVAYFGDTVDFYVDGGRVTDSIPSKIYRLAEQKLERLR